MSASRPPLTAKTWVKKAGKRRRRRMLAVNTQAY
jgi:hypothetical protein